MIIIILIENIVLVKYRILEVSIFLNIFWFFNYHESILLLLQGAFIGIFNQILTGEDIVREKCIKFMSTKVKQLGSEVLTKEVEDVLIENCKKVLQVCLALTFITMILTKWLNGLKLALKKFWIWAI